MSEPIAWPGRPLLAALLAYGITGAVLLAFALVLALVSLGSVERLVRAVDPAGTGGIGDRLGVVSSALDEAAVAIGGFDATLDGTAASARSARLLTERLGGSLRELAVALDVSVLGSRPFAGLGAEFVSVAEDADAMAADLGTTAASLEANRAALLRLRGQIAALEDAVAAVRADVEARAGAPGDAGAGAAAPLPGLPAAGTFLLVRFLAVALLTWLAVPAIAAAVVAVRRLRDGRARAGVTARG